MEREEYRSPSAEQSRKRGAWRRSKAWENGAIVLFLLFAGSAGRAAAQVTEFPIPTPGSYPTHIVAGPDGNLWFTEFQSDRIGRITTAGNVTGEFWAGAPAGNLNDIAVGPDGNLWFLNGGLVGKISPSGVLGDSLDPSMNSPIRITAGPDGNLWITGYYIPQVVRMQLTGERASYAIADDVWLLEITAGPDGNLWFTEASGSNVDRITPSGVITRFPIPSISSTGGIAAGPDGNLWFTESAGRIGRVTTAGVVTEFSIPSGAWGGSIAAGSDGNLWFTEPSGFGRITPAGAVAEFQITGVHPADLAAGPDGNLWFTDPNANRIGRIVPSGMTAPPPAAGPCIEDSTTLCLNEGRFQVRAEWQVPSRGTSGNARTIPLTPDTGAFWFFDATNFEVVVKALNGCSVNGHPWFFAGGLTDVGVKLVVKDTQTGAAKTYLSPAGVAFRPIQDTSAFSTCP